LKNIFENRMVTFLISFLLACILWVYVVQGELQRNKTIQVQLHYLKTRKMVAVGNRPEKLMVHIRGPAAVVGNLAENMHPFDIDLSNAQAGPMVYGNFESLLRQRFPREVEILQVKPSHISLEVEPFSQQFVSLEVTLKGNPREGFQVGKMSVKPNKLKMGGAKSIIEQVEKLVVASIDIEGAQTSIVKEIHFQPESKEFWVLGDDRIEIQIPIQEKILKKEFDVPIRMLNTNYQHSIYPREIRIVVEGTYRIIQGTNVEDFLAYVDGTKMRAGKYRKPIAIKPPDGLKLIDNYPRFFSVRLWK